MEDGIPHGFIGSFMFSSRSFIGLAVLMAYPYATAFVGDWEVIPPHPRDVVASDGSVVFFACAAELNRFQQRLLGYILLLPIAAKEKTGQGGQSA